MASLGDELTSHYGSKGSYSTTSGLAHLRIRTLQPRRPRGNPAQGIPRKQGLLLNRPQFPVGGCGSRGRAACGSHTSATANMISLEHLGIISRGRSSTDWRRCWRGENCSKTLRCCKPSRRRVEQEQELNRLEVQARRELQQDIAALQAKSVASLLDVELSRNLIYWRRC